MRSITTANRVVKKNLTENLGKDLEVGGSQEGKYRSVLRYREQQHKEVGLEVHGDQEGGHRAGAEGAS